MHIIIHEIDPDEVENLREWGAKLMGEHKSEAIRTLEYEGVASEGIFYFELEDKHYIAGVSTAMDGEEQRGSDPENTLNKEHRAVLDAAIKNPAVAKPETLYYLRRS